MIDPDASWVKSLELACGHQWWVGGYGSFAEAFEIPRRKNGTFGAYHCRSCKRKRRITRHGAFTSTLPRRAA